MNLKNVPAAWEDCPKMVGMVAGRNKEGVSVDDGSGTNVGMLFIILQRDDALSTKFNQHAHFQYCNDWWC